MLRLIDLLNKIHDKTRIMLFKDTDVNETMYSGYMEDMSGLMKALCEGYQVIYVRITFNVLFIYIKEISE